MRKILVALMMFAAFFVPASAEATTPTPDLRRVNDTACGQSTWTDLNSNGIPRPMTFNGWGDCSSGGFFGFEKWSYPKYPLTCVSNLTSDPAYKFIYVTNAGNPKTPLIDSNPTGFYGQIRRAVSVFAASENRGVTTTAQLQALRVPRIITDSSCNPVISRVTVPADVMARQPYINWTNPSTGQVEQGLFPYLESHGYPATGLRRYIAVTDTAVGNYRGGKTQVPYAGCDEYNKPVDNRPGPENYNNAGGFWMMVALYGDPAIDLQAGGSSSFGNILAHEFGHGMGAVLCDSANYNAVSGYAHHPKDCADLMCYNHNETPGQVYNACGPATQNTWANYVATDAPYSKPAYRLDCNRNDYYGFYKDGSGNILEKPWAATRWAGENNRFFGGTNVINGVVWNNQNIIIAP